MDKSEIMTLAGKILSDSKTAILSTINEGGPRMRWMSPVFLNNDSDHIYVVSSTGFSKTKDIDKNENVQWMLQSKSLDKIITFNGRMKKIEDLSLRTEVLETIGGKLRTFWSINKDPSSLIVLETEIDSAVMFSPVKGQKHIVSFK